MVDTTRQTVEDIGHLVPSLQTLLLDGSHLPSIRDLGTSLCHLKSLSLNDSQVCELDGLSALPCLRELFLRNNAITSLTPLCTHEGLQVVDLGGNEVCDLDSLEILGTCPLLYSLELADNPITVLAKHAYRPLVLHFIPQLRVLDAKQISATERRECLPVGNDTIELIHHRVGIFVQQQEEELLSQRKGVTDPSTSSSWDQQAISRARFGSNMLASDVDQNQVGALLDASSDLTLGQMTFAGAPTAIMRHQRRSKSASNDVNDDVMARSVLLLDGGHSTTTTGSHSPAVLPLLPEYDPLGSPSERRRSDKKKKKKHRSKHQQGNQAQSPTEHYDAALSLSNDVITSHGEPERVRSAPSTSHDSFAASSLRSFARPTTAGPLGRGSWDHDVIEVPLDGSDDPSLVEARRVRPHTSSHDARPSFLLPPTDEVGSSSSSGAQVTIDVEAQQRQRRKHQRNSRGWSIAEHSPFPFSLPSTAPSVPPLPTVQASESSDEDSDEDDDENVVTRAGLKARAMNASSSSSTRQGSSSSTAAQKHSSIHGGSPGKESKSLSAKAGIKLGFDLHGSLMAINQWSNHDDEEEDTMPSQQPERRPTSGSKAAVVTRDSIIAQCSAVPKTALPGSNQRKGRTSSKRTAGKSEGQIHAMSLAPTAGPAVHLDDASLVEMLRKSPKHVPELRTREGFRSFFRAMPLQRMEVLLRQAYVDKPPDEADYRVKKRLDLLRDVLLSN